MNGYGDPYHIHVVRSAASPGEMALTRRGVSAGSWMGVFQAIRSCSVDADNPQAQSLLKSLCGLQLNKVMARRKEPLVVPRYQLMTFEQLELVRTVARFGVVVPSLVKVALFRTETVSTV